MTEAVINYVALLGWCPEGNQEIFSLEELVKEFDYHNMSKSPAVFDIQKLKWMNGEYLKAMDFDKFFERAEKYIKEVVTKDYDLKKWPIRTAVSGKQSTPGGATEIMEILGKEESLKRIQKGIELLER